MLYPIALRARFTHYCARYPDAVSKADEVEVKISAPDVGTVRTALRRSSFRILKPRVFERNIVLDDENSSLRNRGLLLRVREAGKTVTCTFKGEGKPGAHKRREEREFHADNIDECLALFRGIGYRQSFRLREVSNRVRALGRTRSGHA